MQDPVFLIEKQPFQMCLFDNSIPSYKTINVDNFLPL